MNNANIQNANKLKDEAYKSENKPNGFFSFGRNTEKYEKAADLYYQAGTAYKLGKDFDSAGDAYMKSAENHLRCDNKTDANRSYIEAAGCYRKNNPAKACEVLIHNVIKHYNDNNNLSQSARYYKEVAEIYEADQKWEEAVENYKNAAEIYIDDNKPASATSSHQKVYTILGLRFNGDESKIKEAAETLETLGKESLKTKLGAFSAKGYFFQALLCYTALGNSEALQTKLEEFGRLDYSFPSSLEYELCRGLCDALASYDIELYNQAFDNYVKIAPLDEFKAKMRELGQKKLDGDDHLL